MLRSRLQKTFDCVTFPIRAITLFHEDRWGLSSLASERFEYVAREATGYCLDIGCGRHNRFINEYLDGFGRGIDVFPYDGLTAEHLVDDLTQLEFGDSSFDTVTFIACLNHCPRPQRDAELSEALRVLKPHGKIIITMGNPLAEMLVHAVVWLYDRFLATRVDMDSERGMDDDEDYYLTNRETRGLLERAGFVNCRRKRFLTQWGLNALYVAEKP